MNLAQLGRWQWVAIGICVGLLAGVVANTTGGVDLDNAANSINTQRDFEASILNPVVYGGVKYPQWQDIHVVRVVDPSSASGLSYLVMGKHHARSRMRRPPRTPDPSFKVEYTDHLFRAPVPYVPVSRQLTATTRPARVSAGVLQRLAETLRLKEPDEPNSVLAFLDQVRAQNPDFSYTYQWWRRPRITVAVWTLGSLIFVGGVWPFIVSLLAYGKIFPPAREKGIDLSKVSTRPTEPERRKPEPTAADMDQLRRIESELETRLAASATDVSETTSSVPTPGGPPPPMVPTALKGEKLQAVAEAPKEETVFEAKKDDFYPTQRQHHPK